MEYTKSLWCNVIKNNYYVTFLDYGTGLFSGTIGLQRRFRRKPARDIPEEAGTVAEIALL